MSILTVDEKQKTKTKYDEYDHRYSMSFKYIISIKPLWESNEKLATLIKSASTFNKMNARPTCNREMGNNHKTPKKFLSSYT